MRLVCLLLGALLLGTCPGSGAQEPARKETPPSAATKASKAKAKALGYKSFTAGNFTFERDEYFAHIYYPGGRHIIPIDAYLRSLDGAVPEPELAVAGER